MASAQEQALMIRLQQDTGVRIRLREWESVAFFRETDTSLQVAITTYEVQVLVREDRYKRRGTRALLFTRHPVTDEWLLDWDETIWDSDFEPYVFEKIGRRKTAQELQEQREYEKMCHRPGTSTTPLDSYDRILQGGYTPTEKKIERHF